jgi:hypothetical protein
MKTSSTTVMKTSTLKNTRKEKHQAEILAILMQVPTMNNSLAPWPFDIMKEVIDYLYEPFIAYGFIPDNGVIPIIVDGRFVSAKDDTDNNTTTSTQPITNNCHRYCHRYSSLTLFQRSLYLVYDNTIISHQIAERYDIDKRTWRFLPNHKVELSTPIIITLYDDNYDVEGAFENTKLYLFGKRLLNKNSHQYQCEIYEIKSNRWSEGPKFNLRHERTSVCLTSLKSTFYLFQGTHNYVLVLNTKTAKNIERDKLSWVKVKIGWTSSDVLRYYIPSFEKSWCFTMDDDHIIIILTNYDPSEEHEDSSVYEYEISTSTMHKLQWELPKSLRCPWPFIAWYDRFTNSLFVQRKVLIELQNNDNSDLKTEYKEASIIYVCQPSRHKQLGSMRVRILCDKQDNLIVINDPNCRRDTWKDYWTVLPHSIGIIHSVCSS